MLQKKPLNIAVRAALGLGTAFIALPMMAVAQDNAAGLEEVVVTGSRIQKANLVTGSPVTQLDAEDLSFTGITRLEDVLKDLPQIYQNQGTGQSNGATGTATINLRNLGDQRTLVLVDGKRLPQGTPIQGGDAPDINQIPAALVKRVEVLTGGASSTYGSDAVAGVVNFIMMDDFEGVKLDYQFSRYRHDNDGNVTADLASARGFDVASGTVNDGDIDNMSLLMGGNFSEGRGNAVAYATYRKVEAVTQDQRDYSACALGGGTASCGGSSTAATGRFSDFATYDYTVSGDQFIPWSSAYQYNYGPRNYWQRPDERYTAGALAHFDINEHVTAYTNVSFMDDRTKSQIAESGNFFVTSSIPCGNPFLSAQQFGAIGCTSTDDVVAGYIGRRNVEGGPRGQDLRHTSFRGVFGLKGDIDSNWSYDVSWQYAEVSMENTYLNDLATSRIGRALDVITVDGKPMCRSVANGTDTSCVPWNIFETGGVTRAATDYLALPLYARGTTDQTVFSAFVTGSLGDYGIKMPSAENGIAVVAGIEWREENMEFNPDQGFQKGEGAGQGGPTLGVAGGYEVAEFYAEANIPLVEGAAFADQISLELGYRYSDYDTDQEADTYKVVGTWAVNQQVKLRGSFQRAIRAANLRELYQPQGLNLFDMNSDLCSGVDAGTGLSSAGYNFSQCANSGITQAQWDNGGAPDSPAGQYGFMQGGNTKLEPEKADTYSAGVVLSPDFAEGLDISIDYYDIKIEKAINIIDPETTLTQCVENGQFCDQVNRGAGGSLWIGSANIAATNTNIGYYRVKGWDIVGDYDFDVGSWGSVHINNTMSIIDSWDQQEYDGAVVQSCEGTWGGVCGYPTPDFRNMARATWTTPWDVRVSLAWRHIDKVSDQDELVDIDSQDYFDLAGTWQVTDNAVLRLGVNNLLDEEPPIAGSNAGPSVQGAGNSFPGMYDVLGQYWYVGASLTY